MQENAPPPAARESVPALPPDRERDAGFRGDALVWASVLFGLVFLTGFAIVGMILASRRRAPRQDGGRP